MLELRIVAKDNKVSTDYKEDELCLSDVALIVYEFERIKKELLGIEFEELFSLYGDKKDKSDFK